MDQGPLGETTEGQVDEHLAASMRQILAWLDAGPGRVPAQEVRENLYDLLPGWLTR